MGLCDCSELIENAITSLFLDRFIFHSFRPSFVKRSLSKALYPSHSFLVFPGPFFRSLFIYSQSMSSSTFVLSRLTENRFLLATSLVAAVSSLALCPAIIEPTNKDNLVWLGYCFCWRVCAPSFIRCLVGCDLSSAVDHWMPTGFHVRYFATIPIRGRTGVCYIIGTWWFLLTAWNEKSCWHF